MRAKAPIRRFAAKCSSRQSKPRNTFVFHVAVLFATVLFGCTPAPSDGGPEPSPTPAPLPVDVWVEIDYSNTSSSIIPDWSYSDTPGWAAADWAPAGETEPEVWDVYNNIVITDDPIGRCAVLGSSACLQIMLGPSKLVSYSTTSVRIEGRSASSTTSVFFDVYNPLNMCGTTGSLAHDWSVHLIELNLGSAIVSGEDLQAIRIEPSGGSSSLALVRMRITLHDAEW
jgi:hypothetical protein